MREVGAVDAKTHLSERLAAVEAGERVTLHDALYLELAQRRGAALATLDRALAEAARAEGVAVA